MKKISIKKFNEYYMTTKEDVCKALENIKKSYSHNYGIFEIGNERVDIFMNYIDRFIDKIKGTKFFTLEDWWFFSIHINPKTMSLFLNYLDDYNGSNNEKTVKFTSACEFVVLNVKSLSVKEFAEISNVEDGTVRQWIRRGKLLDAYKAGLEWRIPELASVDEEVNKTHQFEWKEIGPFLSDDYLYLTKSRMISIYKEPHKNKYVIYSNGEKHTITKQEKEKIELMLISHPMINYLSNNLITVIEKEDSYYV